MAVIMQPLPCEKIKAAELWVINNPNAPRIENPTPHEQACLDGYWKAVFKHEEFIAEMQKEIPGWLPKFEMIAA